MPRAVQLRTNSGSGARNRHGGHHSTSSRQHELTGIMQVYRLKCNARYGFSTSRPDGAVSNESEPHTGILGGAASWLRSRENVCHENVCSISSIFETAERSIDATRCGIA